MTEPIVTLRDAAVELGDRAVWSGVDLEVAPGELVAVLGPNGAGKSTLLKLLLGLVPPASGDVLVDGAVPHHGNPAIGYLPQRHGFDASMRIRGRDIVRLGVDGDHLGVPLPRVFSPRARAAAARVDDLLELVDATAFADRAVGRLSGGEQQRILIAQALARAPRLLLLDEPLDSLDLPNQRAIAALLGELGRERGVTILIVAHDVNPIMGVLDRIVYFAGGRAACGRPEDVVTAATLSRLYGTPIEVLYTSDGRPVVVGGPDATSFHPGLHRGHEHHLHG